MKGILKFARVAVVTILVAVFLAACTPANLFISPTLTPTTSPTATSTPSPTSPALPSPTTIPTEVLTPQEQREHDYGKYVPVNEDCVLNEGVPFRDFQPDALYAQFRFHFTGQTKDTTIPIVVNNLEEDRRVKLIQVVCRDSNKNIEEPIWIVLGGYDFGKNRGGENIYWTQGGLGLSVTTPDAMFAQLEPGEEIWVVLPVKTGNSQLKNQFWDHNGGDELADQAIREFPNVKEQIDLLLSRNSITKEDVVLIPVMLKFGPFPEINLTP